MALLRHGARQAWLPSQQLHMHHYTACLHSIPCHRRLQEEGLSNRMFGSIAEASIIGRAGQQTLAQAVAAIKRAKAEAEAREARRARIVQLLTEEGLQAYLPRQYAAGDRPGGFWVDE